MAPVSFDVVSPNTNINTEEAIKTLPEYTIKHNIELHRNETFNLFEVLHLLLDNNIFTYNDTHYQQIRGLAKWATTLVAPLLFCAWTASSDCTSTNNYTLKYLRMLRWWSWHCNIWRWTGKHYWHTWTNHTNHRVWDGTPWQRWLPTDTCHKTEHRSKWQHSPQTLHKTGLEGHQAKLPLAPAKLFEKSCGCQRVQTCWALRISGTQRWSYSGHRNKTNAQQQPTKLDKSSHATLRKEESTETNNIYIQHAIKSCIRAAAYVQFF